MGSMAIASMDHSVRVFVFSLGLPLAFSALLQTGPGRKVTVWILILTLLYAGESARLEHIDGFASQDDCVKAALLWQQSVSNNPMAHLHATCVHR
jgi:hypothetical protein